MVQWLRLHASTMAGMASIPGGETKIPHAVQCSQKKLVKKKKTSGRKYKRISYDLEVGKDCLSISHIC